MGGVKASKKAIKTYAYPFSLAEEKNRCYIVCLLKFSYPMM